MPLFFLCNLAADLINPDRGDLGLKPHKRLISRAPQGFMFGKKWWRSLVKQESDDGHILVVGGAGSGKSSCLAIPSIKSWRERIFAIDIKGELLKQAGHNRQLLKVFDPLDPNSYGYDPFFLLSRSENLVQDARELVFAMIPKPPEIRDSFWIDGARNLLTGAVLHYFHLDYSFIDVMNIVQRLPVQELIDEIRGGDEVAELFVNQFTGMDIKTLSGVYAELSNNIMVFATDPAIKNCLSRQKNIKPLDLEYGADIFLEIPEDRLDQWKPLITLMVNQFMKHFERRPDEGANPILFLLDEFPRLGKVEAVNGLATLRSKKITICLIVQSLAQLDLIYGRDSRKVIADNCAYKAILNATDPETQEYFSRLVGAYERSKVSRSANFDGGTDDTIRSNSRSVTTEERRIIRPERFATLKKIARLSPYGFCWAKKKPYYKNDGLSNRKAYNP